jgi:aryl-alcohol dehydrogenase-like predicted oxidoreductase
METKKISRREFIAETGVKLAGTGVLLNQLGTHPAFGATTAPQEKKKSEQPMAYRTLGRTGLKVSEVSFGVMRLKEPAVLYKAIDLGVNFFDTAHGYQNGNNEKMLGKVAKEHGREKLYIATKVHPFHLQKELPDKFQMLAKSTLEEKFNESLKRLQTDYVDVLYIHNIMEKSWPLNEDVLSFAEKAKKDGKARFMGISIHDPRCFVDAIGLALTTPVYDVILAWYNFKSSPEHEEILKKAKKANRGIVTMKTQAGGYAKGATDSLNPQQAALKWVLDKDFVDCAIPGMVNMEQLTENVGATGKKVGWSDRKTLHAYYNAIKDQYCTMCGSCSATCYSNVDINTVNRALMYCEGYGDFGQGRQTYRELSARVNGLSCIDCSSPSCHCVNGIKIEKRMKHAHSLFA